MKSIHKFKIFCILFVQIPFLVVILLCYAEPPIHVELVASKTWYAWEEPIVLQVRVYNCDEPLKGKQVCAGSKTVAVQRGFFDQEWDRTIYFKGPDGRPVRHPMFSSGTEPQGTFPVISQEKTSPLSVRSKSPHKKPQRQQAVRVDLVPPGEVKVVTLHDARENYDLSQYGMWEAQILLPLQVFNYTTLTVGDEIQAVGYYPPISFYSPLKSNKITFQRAPPISKTIKPIYKSLDRKSILRTINKSQINVYFDRLNITKDVNSPISKTPVKNARVKIYRRSDIPREFYPIDWKNYGQIVRYIKSRGSSLTDTEGVAKFFMEKDDYIVIAEGSLSQHFEFIAEMVDRTAPAWNTIDPVKVWLRAIVRDEVSGDIVIPARTLAGKTTFIENCNLLISEPEFVVWGESMSLYPFVFESVGPFIPVEVTTTLSPPEGFTSEPNTPINIVMTDRRSSLPVMFYVGKKPGQKSVQWNEMGVTYLIKSQGQRLDVSMTHNSSIGVKLTSQFAEAEGVDVLGRKQDK